MNGPRQLYQETSTNSMILFIWYHKDHPLRVSLQENKYFTEMCTIKKRNVTSLRRLDPIVMSLDLKEEVKLCINNSPWRSLDVGGGRDGIPGQVNRVEEGRNGSHLNYCKSGSCREENRLTVWQQWCGRLMMTVAYSVLWRARYERKLE